MKNHEKTTYKIEESAITFISYPLYFSTVRQNPVVEVNQIRAVDLKTYPHSLILKNGEIIFLDHRDKTSLPSFAQKHNLDISDHIDSWSIFARQYLDTELEAKLIEDQDKQLQDVGISNEQLRKIKRKIRWTFFGTMEWNYLGLWDLLAMKQERNPLYKVFGKKFYWWSMRLALKGSKFDNQNDS